MRLNSKFESRDGFLTGTSSTYCMLKNHELNTLFPTLCSIYAAWVNQYREVLYSVTAMLSTNRQTVTCPDQSEWYKMCPCLHLHRSHPNYNLKTSFTWNWQVPRTTVGKFSIRNSLSFVLAECSLSFYQRLQLLDLQTVTWINFPFSLQCLSPGLFPTKSC